MRRLNRIFAGDGKTVVVAMDHGLGLDVNPELDDAGRVLEAVARGGADAILTSYGVARRYEKELAGMGLILRMDGGGSRLWEGAENNRILYSPEEALKIGADAMICMGFPGAPYEYDSMDNVAALAAEAREWGLPLMAEMLPGGFASDVPNTVENVRLAVRYGCEAGADIIKTTYAGTREEFGTIMAAAFKPVIVLGGEKTGDLVSLFDCLESAMACGASGVAIGRNVWKHKDPEAFTKALVAIVHEGAKAADALAMIPR